MTYQLTFEVINAEAAMHIIDLLLNDYDDVKLLRAPRQSLLVEAVMEAEDQLLIAEASALAASAQEAEDEYLARRDTEKWLEGVGEEEYAGLEAEADAINMAKAKAEFHQAQQAKRQQRSGYWVDPTAPKTSGSGVRVDGLEQVPCAKCGAPRDAICVTDLHGGYRRGFGHAERRRARERYIANIEFGNAEEQS